MIVFTSRRLQRFTYIYIYNRDVGARARVSLFRRPPLYISPKIIARCGFVHVGLHVFTTLSRRRRSPPPEPRVPRRRPLALLRRRSPRPSSAGAAGRRPSPCPGRSSCPPPPPPLLRRTEAREQPGPRPSSRRGRRARTRRPAETRCASFSSGRRGRRRARWKVAGPLQPFPSKPCFFFKDDHYSRNRTIQVLAVAARHTLALVRSSAAYSEVTAPFAGARLARSLDSLTQRTHSTQVHCLTRIHHGRSTRPRVSRWPRATRAQAAGRQALVAWRSGRGMSLCYTGRIGEKLSGRLPKGALALGGAGPRRLDTAYMYTGRGSLALRCMEGLTSVRTSGRLPYVLGKPTSRRIR